MQDSNTPAKFQTPFAVNAGAAYIGTIPVASQIGISPGRASLNDGFPPLNFIPVAAGGVPPYGADFNGIFFQTTAGVQWYQAGGPIFYDPVIVAAGGYPKGAFVWSISQVGQGWISTVDNNITNPDAGGANWLPTISFIMTSPTIWVRTDGNDANNGSANNAANAVLTIARALVLAGRYYVPGGAITIRLGLAGTYTAASPPVGMSTPITIQGDVAAQGNYIIAGAGTSTGVIIVQGGASLTLAGVTLNNNNNVTNLLAAAYGGSITCSNVSFTATGVGNTQAAMVSFAGGSVVVGDGCTVGSNFGRLFWAPGGTIQIVTAGAFTTAATPGFSTAVAFASNCGTISCGVATFTGTVTGKRYEADSNGVIDVLGRGANVFFGNAAGTTSTGGQYV